MHFLKQRYSEICLSIRIRILSLNKRKDDSVHTLDRYEKNYRKKTGSHRIRMCRFCSKTKTFKWRFFFRFIKFLRHLEDKGANCGCPVKSVLNYVCIYLFIYIYALYCVHNNVQCWWRQWMQKSPSYFNITAEHIHIPADFALNDVFRQCPKMIWTPASNHFCTTKIYFCVLINSYSTFTKGSQNKRLRNFANKQCNSSYCKHTVYSSNHSSTMVMSLFLIQLFQMVSKLQSYVKSRWCPASCHLNLWSGHVSA